MSFSEIKIIKNIQKSKSNILNKIMILLSAIFHFKFYFTIIIILFLIDKISCSQIIILLYSNIILMYIKNIIKRKRPYQMNKNIKLIDTYSIDPYSFPSGHTFNAFLLTSFLKQNGLNITLLPYLVALSRIYMGVHYPSDIIGGIVFSKIITSIH
jgi:undecaprenyl-diphosphatase